MEILQFDQMGSFNTVWYGKDITFAWMKVITQNSNWKMEAGIKNGIILDSVQN